MLKLKPVSVIQLLICTVHDHDIPQIQHPSKNATLMGLLDYRDKFQTRITRKDIQIIEALIYWISEVSLYKPLTSHHTK